MTTTFGSRFDGILLDSIGAERMVGTEVIQELWSGYGKILRVALAGGDHRSVIVKHVQMPVGGNHPRGWNSGISHDRKVKSYQVETAWYENWSSRCGDLCRVPDCFISEKEGDEVFLVLEDLDAAGFPGRPASVDWNQIDICLRWLAWFHATYLGESPTGLWKTGTYWHLATRPEELEALDDLALRNAASPIDEMLKAAQFQTFVHGDAKLANFCFSPDGEKVSAVDFQYVGGGCGMKDVAYFIGSCLDESSCEDKEAQLLECYFSHLETALRKTRPNLNPGDVIDEWRELFPLAWTDFHRFLKGWCPGHWKLNSYSERLARDVVASL